MSTSSSNGRGDEGLNGPAIPKKTRRMEKARPVLFALNEASGRGFRETEENLLLIAARLEEPGVTVEEAIKMVRRQCQKWKSDPKMSEFMRPQTLFGKQKFDGYFASRDMPILTTKGDEPKGERREIPEFIQIRRAVIGSSQNQATTNP